MKPNNQSNLGVTCDFPDCPKCNPPVGGEGVRAYDPQNSSGTGGLGGRVSEGRGPRADRGDCGRDALPVGDAALGVGDRRPLAPPLGLALDDLRSLVTSEAGHICYLNDCLDDVKAAVDADIAGVIAQADYQAKQFMEALAAGEAREAALLKRLESVNKQLDKNRTSLIVLRADRDYWKEKANSFG